MSNIGLDFGTTYSILSELAGVELKAFLPGINAQSPMQRTIAAKNKQGQIVYGATAKQCLGKLNCRMFTGFKMLLAEKSQSFLCQRGYDETFTPKAVTEGFLNYLITNYMNVTGNREIEKIVIGVPEIWFRSTSLIDCRITLKEILDKDPRVRQVQLVSEPAAACAFFVQNYKKKIGRDFLGRILLIDYGGGTLDITLCDVRQNADRGEVSVRYRTGAGVNEEGSLGKAGLAYLEGVVKIAARPSGMTEQEIVSHKDFYKCVDSLETALIDRTAEISEIFEMEAFADPEALTDVFIDFEIGGEERTVTYGMLARAYNQIIRPVLDEKLRHIIEYMNAENIDYSVNTEDNFKIALVGGFCNFCLTERQIKDRFSIINDSDKRVKDIIQNKMDCEKAISYGTTLIANDIIGFRQAAPYSLGIGNKKGDVYFAIIAGEEITYNKPYFINSHKNADNKLLFRMKRIPRIAFSFNKNTNSARVAEPLERYQSRLTLGENINDLYALAFSLDESLMITLHKYCYPDAQHDRENFTESAVVIDSLEELFGGWIVDEQADGE